MMRHQITTPAHLGDAAAIAALRDAIAAVQARPRLRSELRHLLAETLAEMRMESIAGADMPPEQIVAIARASVQPVRG